MQDEPTGVYVPPASHVMGPAVRVASLSVVVPVYNSADVLPALVVRLEPVLRAVSDEFELVCVNDGSRDTSWNAIADLEKRHAWIRGIDLMRNSGQHNALLCGIRAARYGLIVTLDDDLQNPPEEIPKLLEALDEGVDVVYGAPPHGVHGLWRNLASQMTKIVLQGALGAQTARMVGPFRVFRTELRHAFDQYSSAFVNIDVLLTWGTTRFKAIRVRHDERRIGMSNYTFLTLLTHSMNMTTGFSTMPLKWASILGFGATAFGIVLLAYVLGRYFLHGTSVPGFAFLASVTIIFAGAQLVTLGIIGEYLARVHVRLTERPAYTIRRGAAQAFVAEQNRPVKHE